jgi:penicillin-binding protein 1A
MGWLVSGFYRLAAFGILALIIGGGVMYFAFSAGLPSVDSLKTYKPPLESRVYAENFQLVSALASQRRIYVPYDQIPPIVAEAFISAEDRLFWVHPGINPLAIIRAGVVDVTRFGSGRRPLGASTITEQVVKNMLLDNDVTFANKIKEAILALRVERVMTKPQILTLYLNEIYLGNNSYGIAAAAQAYFDKPLSQLTVAEAASLASLPKAPTSYDPFLHPVEALGRRNFVISRMLADGAITPAQEQVAIAEPLLPRAGGAPQTVPDSGYFADAVKADLMQRFSPEQVSNGGLIIRTSLDPKLQVAAQQAVRDGLERYDHEFDGWHGLVAHVDDADLGDSWQADLAKQVNPPGMRADWFLGIVLAAGDGSTRVGYIDTDDGSGTAGRIGTLDLAADRWARGFAPRDGDIVMLSKVAAGHDLLALQQVPAIEGALVSMDPQTGRVLAIVGGWSHDMSPYNRAIQAERQPGSSVKPFVYLTAMQQGIQPDAPVLDAPFVQQMPDGTVYRPGNYEDDFEGPVTVFHALEQSLNLATLHLAREVGLANIARNFEDFGIVDHMPLYYPSAIGALDTTMWRMISGYAALDEYGRQVTPTLIDSVTDPDGQVLYQAPGQACDNCVSGNPAQPPQLQMPGAQLADPDSVFQVITMMRGVVLRGTGMPAVVGISQPVAGKTGTTNNFNDAWFIGFTPGVVTACWTGFDTPRDLGNNESGGNVCGPIWNEYMKVALVNQPDLDFPVPAGDTLQQTQFNGQTVAEAFKTGQTPGAQSTDSLLAGQDALSQPAAAAGSAPAAAAATQAGQSPPPPPANIDKSLGGLY